jgi:hypothetical protein
MTQFSSDLKKFSFNKNKSKICVNLVKTMNGLKIEFSNFDIICVKYYLLDIKNLKN